MPKKVGQIDPNIITNAKKRGAAIKQLANAELEEEVQSGALLAEKIYLELRDTVLSVLDELYEEESSVEILSNPQFGYQISGATDLLWVSVGPLRCNIQLRIKTKIVPWSDPLPQNRSNRDSWQKYMPKDAICFTFALEGGVVQASDTRYLEGKWVTIRRDGSIYLHPLLASFGNFNDLGGSAQGLGQVALMDDVRDFAISIFTNETYWEYIETS